MSEPALSLMVRPWQRDDAAQLLTLMQGLAEFEGYARDFAVNEQELLRRGLGDVPQFEALVAEREELPGTLLGAAVYYFVPYTFDLRPDLVLKELYIAEHARSMGVGQALMARLKFRAVEAGSKRIKWLVLPDNHRAKRFYEACGAKHDRDWENWSMIVSD